MQSTNLKTIVNEVISSLGFGDVTGTSYLKEAVSMAIEKQAE